MNIYQILENFNKFSSVSAWVRTRGLTHSQIDGLTYGLTDSLTLELAHSVTNSLTNSRTHSRIHSWTDGSQIF